AKKAKKPLKNTFCYAIIIVYTYNVTTRQKRKHRRTWESQAVRGDRMMNRSKIYRLH
uniref:Uncharacterized protein n=1 Tax=Onchocerca volvulus TaxID=6282 RepID=A0A8R1Y629_ONCVO